MPPPMRLIRTIQIRKKIAAGATHDNTAESHLFWATAV